jgi:hypothetical protein
VWPTGHLSWFFDGISQFEAAITTFLAEGFALGERLTVVAEDPNEALWPPVLIERGDLILTDTSEVYGSERIVAAQAEEDRLATSLDEALYLGYTGLRRASDNTSLISGPQRWAAWTRWEAVVDRFIADNPVTEMCAFDRYRTAAPTVAALRQLHPISVDD